MRPTKRAELVRKALEVFYRNGFHASGMDMLVAETGISKTSMYKHFRSKEDLILAALHLRDEEFRTWLVRRPEQLGATPRDRLIAIFDALGEWFAEEDFRGCIFLKATAEYQEAEHPIHAQSAETNRLILRQIRTVAEEAGAADPSALSRGLFLLMQGAVMTAHLGHTNDPAMDAKAAAKILVDEAVGAG